MDNKKIIQFSLLAAFLIAWSVLILRLGTQRIVELIGTNNSYIILFIVGTTGGVSTLTSSSFYTTLSTFAVGGLNPFLLAVIGGLGISIGDTIFYLLGKKGEESLPSKARKITKKFSHWIENRPAWLVPIVTFVYSGMTPFPNDILTVSLGLARYRYLYMIIPLILGNIFLTGLVAFVAASFA